MTISPQTQAILLLTSHFSKPTENEVKPLTPKEWGRFAIWLKQQEVNPDQLLTGKLPDWLATWKDQDIPLDRIEQLLNRGSALAFAMEKWTRAGLWVLTRTDETYPIYLKQRLKSDSPAILFGCGNQKLLNQGGIAVVGSRHTSEEDLAYSRRLGQTAAEQGYTLISGGARGVDETAMLGTLTHEGTVVGVLADSLLRACCSANYRPSLMNNNLVLISPFYPEAGFNVGNAMFRNKYIYCLSDSSVVIHSDKKGGTWTGALENLKKGWVRLWVKPTQDLLAGNADLVQAGGQWLAETEASQLELRHLLTTTGPDLDSPQAAELSETLNSVINSSNIPLELDFYEFFLLKIQTLCHSQAKTAEELAKQLNIKKSQLESWLKRAMVDKKIQKLSKPVSYRWKTVLPEQKSIF